MYYMEYNEKERSIYSTEYNGKKYKMMEKREKISLFHYTWAPKYVRLRPTAIQIKLSSISDR